MYICILKLNTMKKQLTPGYLNPYGTWIVTTEGDVEGRTIRHLGTFTGFVDEIALHLADKCSYSLRFQKTETVKEYKPKADSVHISFDIDSGTWDMNPKERMEVMKDMFRSRPVQIKEGRYYASFVISGVMTEEDKMNIQREKILSKLSKEEREILGYK